MFSILILGIGLVSVASLFPVAGTLQRSTVEDVEADLVARNAIAMLQTIGIDRGALENDPDVQRVMSAGTLGDVLLPLSNRGRVVPWKDVDDPAAVAARPWPMVDRSFPSTKPFLQRDYYWVALFRYDRDSEISDEDPWEVHIFVLKTVEGYPPDDGNVLGPAGSLTLPQEDLDNANPLGNPRVNAGDIVLYGGPDPFTDPRAHSYDIDRRAGQNEFNAIVAGKTSTFKAYAVTKGVVR